MRPIARDAVLLAAAAVVVLAFFDSTLSLTGDNGEFIVLGRALASGQGLVYGNLPKPDPAIKYPPGFPALLALADLTFPNSIVAMKALVLVLFVVSVLLVYRVVAHEAGPVSGWMAAGFCLVSYALLESSHIVMSEVPYLAASLLAIRALQRGGRGPTGVPIIALACAAAYYQRSVGVVLIPAAAAVLMLEGRPRQGLAAAGAIVLLVAPWVLYCRAAAPGGYVDVLLSANPYGPHTEGASVLDLLGRLGWNVWNYGLLIVPQVLFPNPFLYYDRTGQFPPWVWVPAAACCLALAGYLLAFRRPTPVRIYLILYAGVVLLWPEVWSDRRLLVPVTPLLFYAVVDTVRRLAHRTVRNTAAVALNPGREDLRVGLVEAHLAAGDTAAALAALQAATEAVPESRQLQSLRSQIAGGGWRP